METRYIRMGEACVLLGISRPVLYRLIERRILPAVQTGGKFRLNREDVEQLNKTGWSWADAPTRAD